MKYYLETSGPHPEDIEKAFNFAISLAKQDAEVRRIVFYSYTKNNFMQVDRFFSDRYNTEIPANGIGISSMNVLVKYETKITYKKQYAIDASDIVIACHMDSKDIYLLDDDRKVKYIIAIPWVEHGVDAWVKRWNAIEISGKGKTEKADTKDKESTLLSIALQEMDIQMFQSKDFHHLDDENTCKTYIRAIHKYIPEVTPDEIEDYLVTQLSWTASNASEVGKQLARLKEGRTFKGGATVGLRNYYKAWKDKLSKKS